jgi:hypothetical protein
VLAAALHRETEPQVQQRLLAALAHFSDPRGLTAMVAWWLTRPANDPMLSTAQGALGGHNPCQVLTALVTLGHVNPPRVRTLKVAPLAGDCPVATVAPPWLGAPLSTLANHSLEPPSD